MFNKPVVFIVFNRPKHTKKTFEIIKKIQPSQLFIIADGPRFEVKEDKKNCAKVREVISKINWNCKIYTNFSDINLGLKKRISTGLNWVFQNVEEAIILEDDCLADIDFFKFCEKLLDVYADNNKVWVISGNNFLRGNMFNNESYYFSKYAHIWGWATWRRAWKYYTDNIPFWNSWKNSNSWKLLIADKVERKFWEKIFNEVHYGKGNIAWDYAWLANIWYHKGLSIVPNKNLVSNIGFDSEATTTKKSVKFVSKIKLEKLQIPLIHPKKIIINLKADKFDFDYNFGGKNFRFPNIIFIFPFRLYRFFLRKIKNLFFS